MMRIAYPPQNPVRNRLWRQLLAIATLLLCLGSPNFVRAENPDDLALLHDFEQTLTVRKVLQENQILAPLNIGVKVENRIAYLWGPIPSTDLMKLAMATVRKLPGILEVRNNLHVDDFEYEQPIQPINPLLAQEHLQSNFDPLQPRLPIAKPIHSMSLSMGYTPGPLNTSGWQPVNKNQSAHPGNLVQKSDPENKLIVRAKSDDLYQWTGGKRAEDVRFRPATEGGGMPFEESEFFELPAIGLPGQALSNANLGQQTGVPQNKKPLSLSQEIQNMKNGDPRYQNITLEIKDQRIYLGGQVRDLRDVHELAQAISRLATVKGVVIGQIQVQGSQK